MFTFDECNTDHGDCTNFRIKEFHFCDNYFCNQEGIHFHCTKHPEIELDYDNDFNGDILTCPKCKNQIEIGSTKALISRCLRVLNREIFKDATLIRLDDWYTPEIKEKSNPLLIIVLQQMLRPIKMGIRLLFFMSVMSVPAIKCNILSNQKKVNSQATTKIWIRQRLFQKLRLRLKIVF